MARFKYERQSLGDKSEEQIDEAILKREAIPELRFKLAIFDALRDMVLAEKKMMMNKSIHKRNKAIDIDKFEFQNSIIVLYSYLKYMIKHNIDKADLNDKVLYNELEKLEYGSKTFSDKELIEMKNFILKYLHLLRLTDLTRKKIDAFDEFQELY